jgi:hypothetical protein
MKLIRRLSTVLRMQFQVSVNKLHELETERIGLFSDFDRVEKTEIPNLVDDHSWAPHSSALYFVWLQTSHEGALT